MTKAWIAVIAATLSLSACTITVSGSAKGTADGATPTTAAARKQPVDPQRLTAEAVLGDLVFVDLCEFLRPADLASFGRAELGVPVGFDSCAVDILRADGEYVEVTVGEIDSADAGDAKTTDLGGGLKSAEVHAEPGLCVRELLFPDEVGMLVHVFAEEVDDDLCPIADKAIAAMVDRFPDGIDSTREVAPNSLARLKACDVLPDSAADHVPGIRKSVTYEVLTGHACEIGSPSESAPYLTLELIVSLEDAGADATKSTIAGRESLVYTPVDDADTGLRSCSVATYHRPFRAAGMSDLGEYAMVTVWVKEADAKPGCPQGRAVAELVWPRLPK